MHNPVRPKKALGQHFLRDLDIARRIAGTLDDYRGLPVLEIGPGTGVLTQFLLESHTAENVTLAEIDTESVDYLRRELPEPQPRIVEGDFLRMDISSQIFFRVLDWKDRVVCCSGMLQREVAQRLAAPEGSRTRGILSVLLQAWYDVEYLFTVDENVFNPPPKVKSGVVRLRRNGVDDIGCAPALFRTVVKTAFGQRRKTLRNSIRPLLGPKPVDVPMEGLRPEQLSVGQFVELTNIIASSRS